MNSTQSWSVIASVMVSAFGVAVAAAGVAGATEGEDNFIANLDSSGIIGPRQDLLNLGYQACSPVPQEVSVNAIVASSGLTPDGATFIYQSGKTFLCN
jgi:Protein of unknown function (DUF732)